MFDFRALELRLSLMSDSVLDLLAEYGLSTNGVDALSATLCTFSESRLVDLYERMTALESDNEATLLAALPSRTRLVCQDHYYRRSLLRSLLIYDELILRDPFQEVLAEFFSGQTQRPLKFQAPILAKALEPMLDIAPLIRRRKLTLVRGWRTDEPPSRTRFAFLRHLLDRNGDLHKRLIDQFLENHR